MHCANVAGVKEERFSGAERAFCVEEFYKNDKSATIVRKKFCNHYHLDNLNEAPSIKLIKTWVQRFEETGSTLS